MRIYIEKNIWFVTAVLAAVAGYCDSVTFIYGNKIFSAHITGNFIVFAFDAIKGADWKSWMKLLTFPVFITSVVTAGWVARKTNNWQILLLIEGILLSVSGLVDYTITKCGILDFQWLYFGVMMIVFAMGFQNTFGKIFNREILVPTTIMTGNVTQASLDASSLLRSRTRNQATLTSLKKHLLAVGSFLCGCIAGAVIGKFVGLSAVAVPGLVLVTVFRNAVRSVSAVETEKYSV